MNAIKVLKHVTVETEIYKITDGTYLGSWTGFIVNFETNRKFNKEQYEVELDRAVKGRNIPCTVTINNGKIEVTTR